MIDPEEIGRFKANLDCRSEDCDWHEDKNGTAWCEVCGSGYLASARVFLSLRDRRTSSSSKDLNSSKSLSRSS